HPPPNTPQKPPPQQSGVPPRRTWWTFLAVLLLNYMLLRVYSTHADETVTVPYTVFKEQVAAKNVDSIFSQGQSIEGQFVAPVSVPTPEAAAGQAGSPASTVRATTFNTLLPDFIDP